MASFEFKLTFFENGMKEAFRKYLVFAFEGDCVKSLNDYLNILHIKNQIL